MKNFFVGTYSTILLEQYNINQKISHVLPLIFKLALERGERHEITLNKVTYLCKPRFTYTKNSYEISQVVDCKQRFDLVKV